MATNLEIITFCESNSPETVLLYKSDLLKNIADSQKIQNSITKWMFSLALFYFLLSESLIKSLSISGLEIGRIDLLKQYIPPIISFLFLLYVITATFSADLIKAFKIVFTFCYKVPGFDAGDFKPNYINPFQRLISPMSFFKETQNSKVGKTMSLSDIIFTFPLAFIQILPLIFIYTGTKITINDYWNSISGKFCVFFSCWLVLYALFYFFRYLMIETKEAIGGNI